MGRSEKVSGRALGFGWRPKGGHGAGPTDSWERRLHRGGDSSPRPPRGPVAEQRSRPGGPGPRALEMRLETPGVSVCWPLGEGWIWSLNFIQEPFTVGRRVTLTEVQFSRSVRLPCGDRWQPSSMPSVWLLGGDVVSRPGSATDGLCATPGMSPEPPACSQATGPRRSGVWGYKRQTPRLRRGKWAVLEATVFVLRVCGGKERKCSARVATTSHNLTATRWPRSADQEPGSLFLH